MKTLDAIDTDERTFIELDFSGALAEGETLTTPVTVTAALDPASVATDASPTLVLQNVVQISPDGRKVYVGVQGRVSGCRYTIKTRPSCTNPYKAPVINVTLPCRNGA